MVPTPLSDPKTCPECSREFARLSASGLCWGCDEKRLEAIARAEAAQRILAELPAEVDKRLQWAGLESRELRAERDRIPAGIRQALPHEPTGAMKDGRIPIRGWGLWGPTGIGKSMALAALARAYATAALQRRAPIEGEVPMDLGIEWCNWPAAADWMRLNGTDAGAIARKVRRLSEVPILILDDLARERRRGNAQEDFAIGKLDLIIDARSRAELPTIWTANVSPKDMVPSYGSALVSRLEGENPSVAVTGKDLRLG